MAAGADLLGIPNMSLPAISSPATYDKQEHIYSNSPSGKSLTIAILSLAKTSVMPLSYLWNFSIFVGITSASFNP